MVYVNPCSSLALNSEDRIELKVFGIEAAGPNIKEDLVQVLHHKLNEKVVEIISTLLQRNPMCKLTPEDVLFLQGSTSLPSQCVRFKVIEFSPSFLQSIFLTRDSGIGELLEYVRNCVRIEKFQSSQIHLNTVKYI